MPIRKKNKNKAVGIPASMEISVSAPGGPPVNIPIAKKAENHVTSNQAKFVTDLVNVSRSPNEKNPMVSRVGEKLMVVTPQAKNYDKVKDSSKFLRSTAYRECIVGKRLFIAAKLSKAKKLEWKTNALLEKTKVFEKMAVGSDEDLLKVLITTPNGLMNFTIIGMLTNPELPDYIIELIAEGFNPLALVKSTEISGPFQELSIRPGGGGDPQEVCDTCIGPGPFSINGQCMPCAQKQQSSGEPTLADLSSFGNIHF